MARNKTPPVKAEDVERVFEAWQRRQARPQWNRLTDEREKLIRARLKLGYTADELITLVDFAYDSDHDSARFWRGERTGHHRGPRKTYLDLENLLRVHKLGARIPVVMEWAEQERARRDGAAVLRDHPEHDGATPHLFDVGRREEDTQPLTSRPSRVSSTRTAVARLRRRRRRPLKAGGES